MRLTTPRLSLRPFEDGDFEAVCAFRGDEQVMRYITAAAEAPDEIQAFLKRTKAYAQAQPQTQYRFAVVLASEQRVIGGSGLDITNPEGCEGEIGYHLHRDYWGQGFATETAMELLRFGFQALHLHRIFADCVAENTASARVMEKAGMRQEAHFCRNKRLGEQWHDTLLYAVLDTD